MNEVSASISATLCVSIEVFPPLKGSALLSTEGFEIYTDGSCKGLWGSWSYILIQNGEILREASGRERKTNSNRMEFQAAIEGIQSLEEESVVTLYTDSRILIENISLFSTWSANSWKKKDNRPIANADLFIILADLLQKRLVTWKWVRAHSGNPYNERCDELCVLAREPSAGIMLTSNR